MKFIIGKKNNTDEKAKKPRKKGYFTLFRENPLAFFLHSLFMAFLMVAITIGVFLYVVRPAEQVLVPNVVGRDLTDALLILQERELYPRLILRFTDSAAEKNRVLEQSIKDGMISKAGRRITLTVSQGLPITEVENFVGQNLLDVQLRIKSLFSGASALLTVAAPEFAESELPENTIISQEPPAGTPLESATQLKLTVSKGAVAKRINVPNLAGKTIDVIYEMMESTPLIFDFAAVESENAESWGHFSGQSPARSSDPVLVYSTLHSDFSIPPKSSNNADEEGLIYGVYAKKISVYPFSMPAKVEMLDETGEKVPLINFKHSGGLFTFPYVAKKGTQFVFSINDEEFDRFEVK